MFVVFLMNFGGKFVLETQMQTQIQRPKVNWKKQHPVSLVWFLFSFSFFRDNELSVAHSRRSNRHFLYCTHIKVIFNSQTFNLRLRNISYNLTNVRHLTQHLHQDFVHELCYNTALFVRCFCFCFFSFPFEVNAVKWSVRRRFWKRGRPKQDNK